jgi:hypothetical protein
LIERIIDSPIRGFTLSMANDVTAFLRYPEFKETKDEYLKALVESCEARV